MSEEFDQLNHEIDVVRTDLADLQTSVDNLHDVPAAVEQHEKELTSIVDTLELAVKTIELQGIRLEQLSAKML